ncbi:MAG: PIG-L family deacetylase [Candidatus Competibacter sp.]|nr:PIG-L family deacetylase [Candidatus Competibacter sp.]
MNKWRRLLIDGLLAVNRLVSSGEPLLRTHNASVLVFAPHPDDEVLGCGGTIALKAQAGARIKVVVMTDGRASHRALIAENDLIKMRRAEAKDAALELGLTAEDYIFLDFEDHRLHQYRSAAIDRVFATIEQFEPDEIYLPNRRDKISDHVETNRVVRAAVRRTNRSARLLEYPVWLWNSWPWTLGNTRYASDKVRQVLGTVRDIVELVFMCRAKVNVSAVLHLKLAALAAYRSQIYRFGGNPRWPVLADVADGEFLRRFKTDIEVFRRTDHHP